MTNTTKKEQKIYESVTTTVFSTYKHSVSFSFFQVSEFPCVCFLEVLVPQHQLKGGRGSRFLKERNTEEPASLPVTSTHQKTQCNPPLKSFHLACSPRVINQCTFIPVCLKRRPLAQHCIDHDGAETVIL